MTTMAGMAFGETPERVLRRVQQLEDVELPSLPSFSHDIDYESDFGGSEQAEGEATGDEAEGGSMDMATPHPRRQVTKLDQSFSQESSTTTDSPFPPMDESVTQHQTSMSAPSAFTSTPIARSRSRSLGKSGRTDRTIGNSTKVSSSRWQTPGDMSYSFSGEEILQEDGEDLGSERSVPLNDASSRMNRSSVAATSSTTTPLGKRLSVSHVTLERPRRRVTSGPASLQALQDVASEIEEESAGGTSVRSGSPAELETQPNLAVPGTDRVPSLTRSEMSAPETSTGATTPEAPSRRVAMLTPRSENEQSRMHDEDGQQLSGDVEWLDRSEVTEADNALREQVSPSMAEGGHEVHEQHDQSQLAVSFASPAKAGASVSYAQYSTPGLGRDAPSGIASPRSLNYTNDSRGMSPMQDITAGMSNLPPLPFTPTPMGFNSKYDSLSTPRAPLDDAERRKSHVLAVLSSSGIPARTPRTALRGTPHPLRRVSVAPASESIAEEGTSGSQRAFSATPGSRTTLSARDASFHSFNDSFVSIASSADLTSDKRASQYTSRTVRANTSVPNILLPGSISHNSPGGSLRGISDQRANGVKIHKHLNAMNKQLLDSNADLAREAEAWRDEVDRLKGLLNDAGVEVEEIDVLAQLPERSQADLSMPSAILRQRRNSTPGETSGNGSRMLERAHSAPLDGEHNHTALLDEMAEKLEGFEGALAEKDEIIAELEHRLDSAETNAPITETEAHQLLDELRAQLEEAEQLRETLHSDFAHKTEQHAQRFGEICTGFEEQVKSLEGQLEASQAEADRLRADKTRMEDIASAAGSDERDREWRKQVTGLELDLGRAREEARAKSAEVEKMHKDADGIRFERDDLAQQLHTVIAERDDLQRTITDGSGPAAQNLDEARDRIEQLQQQIAQAEDEITTLRSAAEAHQTEVDHNQEEVQLLATKLEELESAQVEREHDDDELQRLHRVIEEVNGTLAEKEEEVEALRAKIQVQDLRQSTSLSPARYRDTSEGDAVVEDNNFVAALEERLDEAHREIGRLKHELSATPHRTSSIDVRDARIKALEREKAALTGRLAAKETSLLAGTSLQAAESPFKATPFVHKAIASLKTPKTPGSLKELSWLQSSVGDANEPILRAQMEYLQDELKHANDQLDSNFSRLEDAGFNALALAEKLAKAHERIGELEDEIRALSSRNKASLALVTAQRDEENRDHEDHLQKALTEMHEQMDDLKADLASERARLQRDNQRLQDLLSEVNLKRQAEVDSFRSEIARLEEETEAELREARQETAALGEQVETLQQDKQQSATRLKQVEHDLAVQLDAYDDLKSQLARQEMSEDVREEIEAAHARVESLEAMLRDTNLATDRLRQSLRDKSDALRHAESKVETLQRERQAIAKDMVSFEQDLKQQRLASEQFGRELSGLHRDEVKAHIYEEQIDHLRRDYRAARESLQHAKDQLARAVQQVKELESWRQQHESDGGESTAKALAEQKARFKSQTRDLATQIRYLKAKYTREATFRNGLSLQKRYYLLMIGSMSLNEQATMKAMASMGCPVPPIKRPKRTLKHAALAVISLIRARKLAADWRGEIELKAEAIHSHQERRRASGKA